MKDLCCVRFYVLSLGVKSASELTGVTPEIIICPHLIAPHLNVLISPSLLHAFDIFYLMLSLQS